MIVTTTRGTDWLLMPLRHCGTCATDRPAVVCSTHTICQACGQVRIEPEGAVADG